MVGSVGERPPHRERRGDRGLGPETWRRSSHKAASGGLWSRVHPLGDGGEAAASRSRRGQVRPRRTSITPEPPDSTMQRDLSESHDCRGGGEEVANLSRRRTFLRTCEPESRERAIRGQSGCGDEGEGRWSGVVAGKSQVAEATPHLPRSHTTNKAAGVPKRHKPPGSAIPAGSAGNADTDQTPAGDSSRDVSTRCDPNRRSRIEPRF